MAMGEFTTCNFCDLQGMKARAKARGNRIELRPSNTGGIYVHELKPGEALNLKPWDDGNPQILAWFMALTDACAC